MYNVILCTVIYNEKYYVKFVHLGMFFSSPVNLQKPVFDRILSVTDDMCGNKICINVIVTTCISVSVRVSLAKASYLAVVWSRA